MSDEVLDVGVGLNRSVAVITDLEDRTAAVIDVERIVAHRNEGVALGRRATMMNPEVPVAEVVEEGIAHARIGVMMSV